MEPQFNEVPRDQGKWFVISRARYAEVLFHTFYFYWAEGCGLLYQRLCYIEIKSRLLCILIDEATGKLDCKRGYPDYNFFSLR